MADSGKAAKLAAARQKLKDHQQKKYIQSINPSISPVMDNASTNLEAQEAASLNLEPQEAASLRGEVNDTKLDTTNSNTMIISTNTEIPIVTSTERNTKDTYNLQMNEPITPQHVVQQQTQHHMIATEILVKDKRNLEAKVRDLEASLLHVENKYQETSSNVNLAKQNIVKLESDMRDSKDIINNLRRELDSRMTEIEKYKLNEGKLIERKTDLEEQLESTKTLLVARQTENNALQSQLAQVHKMLDISQLHLQQLRDGEHVSENNTDSTPEALIAQVKSLQNFSSRLEQQVNSAQIEKEQLVLHYQQHIDRLYEQKESTAARCRQLQQDNERLAEREASLVDQMSVVEKRMQGLLSLKEELMKKLQHVGNVTDVDNSELDELRLQLNASKEQIALLQDDYNRVRRQLSDAELKIIEWTETVKNMESDRPDVTKLNAANESDKVAAQRATIQNAKLKEDLQSLQDAFVAMSNDKLELTEKLQAEKFLNRELTIKLSEAEETLKEIQNTLMAKDKEMIRLQASCSQLEKEILQHTQELDRLRHYEATQSNLMKELELAQRTVTKLNHEISTLRNINHSHTSTPNNNETETLSTQYANGADVIEGTKLFNQHDAIVTDTNLNLVIPTEEAMIKLQQRFLKTMKDVAELSDEKQKLEHLVLQLQGETETICEYIALYQQQRSILNQREEERAAQMKYLAAERQHMKEQLEQLRCLVTAETFLASEFKQEKVEKIVHLLSEIKQSHLIEPDKQCSGLENFHPCPWCSGQLINV